ncbi:MAG: lysophospholipid acyltransferase family protein [Candidatus Zixiibacteriota bacterium]
MKSYYHLCYRALNFLFRVFLRFKKLGEEFIPRNGGVIIASNHTAYIDPTLLGAASPRELFFLAKKELFRNKLLGWFLEKLNTIPISRGEYDRKGLKRSVELLKEGNALVLFPEGTRSKNGKLQEARPGIGIIALEADVPIVPAYIRNSRNLIQSILKGESVGVIFGNPVEPTWLKKVPRNKEGYRLIGQEIMRRIRTLKEDLRN